MYEEKARNLNLYLTYVMGVLFTFHMAIPVYINSSFLSEIVAESKVGLLYTIGSFLTIFAIIWMSNSLPRFGNFRTALFIILLEAVAVALLAFSSVTSVLFIAFFAHLILTVLLALNLDIFVESFSKDSETGRIRGMYLTVNNIAWVVAPTIAGFLTMGVDFSRVYIVSLLFLFPLLAILFWYFRGFRDPQYEELPPKESFSHVWNLPDLRYIFLSNFTLRVFFALMVVYTPIYLIQHVGLGFDDMGIIFTIMLSAYILLEYPLGRIADTKLGEKEILIGGFIVIFASTALLSFITTPSVVWWALALFMTRVGGAMVETMSETYFFKKTDGGDVSDLSIFRMTKPIGYTIAPLIASLFLLLTSIQWIFALAAVLVLPGIFFGSKIKDTL